MLMSCNPLFSAKRNNALLNKSQVTASMASHNQETHTLAQIAHPLQHRREKHTGVPGDGEVIAITTVCEQASSFQSQALIATSVLTAVFGAATIAMIAYAVVSMKKQQGSV